MTYSMPGGVCAPAARHWHPPESPGVTYSAIACCGVTLLKLFFHDLTQLDPIRRIGALPAVAVIAMLASFAITLLRLRRQKDKETKNEKRNEDDEKKCPSAR